MDMHSTFLAEVEKHLTARGLSPTQFGREAINDTHFVADLRNGRSPGLRTVERVRKYMEANAPTAQET